MLAPGGRLLLTVPFLYPIHDDPYDFQRYTRNGLKVVLERAGMRVEQLQSHGHAVETAALAANLALTLVSRGEFALILVALAVPAGLDARLAPFAAGYVLVLALGGPFLAANPRWLATAYRRMLPV